MPFPTDHILAYSVVAARVVSREIVADIKRTISTDCPQYHTGKGGHSHRGSAPYKESGVLEKSITPLVTSTPDGVSVTVYSNVPYAPKLEKKMDRPFMGPAQKRWLPEVIKRLQNIPPIP